MYIYIYIYIYKYSDISLCLAVGCYSEVFLHCAHVGSARTERKGVFWWDKVGCSS